MTLEIFANHSYFYYLDDYYEFSQIIVHSNDQLKTTFTCLFRLYAYRRMSFGVCNAQPLIKDA
jgi:hypothetical protein